MKEGSGNGTSLYMGAVLGEPERYVKEGFGKRHLSLYGPFWGTWRGLLYQGLLEMDIGTLQGEPGGLF